MFSQFFIERPRFAVVISIALALAGIISAFSLPIKQYPDITLPQIRVSANYPGADAKALTNTVAAPLEDATPSPSPSRRARTRTWPW